jgi:NO-binding membrane sensor protein with MHYT domain
MNGNYDLGLVALSIAIAVIASYTALDLANRVSNSVANPPKAWAWLGAGALSMGTGIWAMHFIGMLAFHLPIALAYDIPLTLLSMLIAVAVSAVALFVLRQPIVSRQSWLTGAGLMGIGISAMHYTGMAAMRMSPAIQYDPLLFVTSVTIAFVAALAALWIALRLRTALPEYAVLAKLASAGIMGLAITGMHYTGMAAARFAPGSMCLAAGSGGLQNTTLAIAIGCVAMGILSFTIVLATIDAHFAVRNAHLAASLRVAKESAESALQENEKVNAALRAAQGELVSSARRAGMAEVANNVLHNVGNVLNSVTVSGGVLRSRLQASRADNLRRIVHLLNEHAADLTEFFARDERGRRLPEYLGKIADTLASDQRELLGEVSALCRSIEHIQAIVTTQQAYAGSTSVLEAVRVEDLVEDALRMSCAATPRPNVSIKREFAPTPKVLLDRHLTLQILISLLTNALQALDRVCDRAGPGHIAIRVAGSEVQGESRLKIAVADTGDGIAPENLTRVFGHGFTTRGSRHGLGLHGSALAAKAMGGLLTVQSEGPGQGAEFTLDLPLKLERHTHEHARESASTAG